MASTVYDLAGSLALEKGVPWVLELTRFNPDGSPVDLTGLGARLEIFDALASGLPLITLSDVSGEIVLGGTAGTFKATLPDAASAALTATNLRYRLVFVDGGVDYPYMRGRLGFVGEDE